MNSELNDITACIVGIGYVGPPLALAFSCHLKTIVSDVKFFEKKFSKTIRHSAPQSYPCARRNRINKNDYWAVSVTERCGGTIEDNDLRGNVEGAWEVSADSKPNLRRARNKE